MVQNELVNHLDKGYNNMYKVVCERTSQGKQQKKESFFETIEKAEMAYNNHIYFAGRGIIWHTITMYDSNENFISQAILDKVRL